MKNVSLIYRKIQQKVLNGKGLRKFYGRQVDLIQQYEVSFSRMLNDILALDQQ